jgi:hypothetical protein
MIQTKNLKSTKININGYNYKGINSIGFASYGSFVYDVIIDNSYNYHSNIPISDKEYREEMPTDTDYYVESSGIFSIADDYGKVNYIISSKEVINALVEECKENDIPERNDLTFSSDDV